MNCPRCNSSLREIEPGPIWLRHFLCDECWTAWHFERLGYVTADEITKIRYFKTEVWLELGRETREERLAAA
jgi:hypothetical protein